MEEKRIIIKFVIVLLLISSFIATGILFKDVTIKDTYSYNSRFVTVLDEGSFEIIVDKNTKVMYLQSTRGTGYQGYGGLTVMVDAQGLPLLWKE